MIPVPRDSRRARDLRSRARRVLDRIDLRIEHQTFREGADAPHCVATVGAYTRYAAIFEMNLEKRIALSWKERIVRDLRQLRRVARDHAIMVSMQGQKLRMARTETVQRAIRDAKRGTTTGEPT